MGCSTNESYIYGFGGRNEAFGVRVAHSSDTFAVESRLREISTCQELVQCHEIMLQSVGYGIKYRAR